MGKVSAEVMLEEGLFNHMRYENLGDRIKIRLYSYIADVVAELEYEVKPNGKRVKVRDSMVDEECLERIRSALRRQPRPTPPWSRG